MERKKKGTEYMVWTGFRKPVPETGGREGGGGEADPGTATNPVPIECLFQPFFCKLLFLKKLKI